MKRSLNIFDFVESNIVPSNDQHVVNSEFAAYDNIYIDSNLSALKFWLEKSKKLPILSKVAKHFFTAQATSTPSERLFSKAGYTTWDRRNKLSPHKIDKMMIIYSYERNILNKNRQFNQNKN